METNELIQVRATREGLVGKPTATGWLIDSKVPFVALPSTLALHRAIRITNPRNGISVDAIVMDVGPWNEHDDEYVFRGQRPMAETGKDTRGRTTNGAGIDLGEYVWKALGMTGNDEVCWRFLV